MAVSPINVSRITHTMRSSQILGSLRQNQLELFRIQSRLATGRRFATPSEDPAAAARVIDMTQALARAEQFMSNVRHGDNTLAAADNALAEIGGLLSDAHSIGSQTVSNLVSAAERASEAEVLAGITRQLQNVGNRIFNNRFVFAGLATTAQPFVNALGGIAYVGDTSELLTRINSNLTTEVSVTGNVLYGALSSRITSDVDLSPLLTADVRLEDLGGAMSLGVRTGVLTVNEGGSTFNVDLSTADTIEDVVDLFNRAAAVAGASVTASLGDRGLVITPSGKAVSITDAAGGIVAADLGILTREETTAPIEGADLQPRVTRLTPIESLAGGVGIDIDSGFIVTNGGQSVTIDLSDAKTVQDIINRINNSGLYLRARINDTGTGIDVFNQVSGVSLTIGENGGTTASDLGIRTYSEATPLSGLNNGIGVFRQEGLTDIAITAADGSVVEVDLDAADTVGDVIALINDAATEAGVSITASLAEVGNGIRIVDGTGGADKLSVGAINGSEAAFNLGLVVSVDEGSAELIGEDRNPTRTDGILSALIELEAALRADDTQGISLAAERIDELTQNVIRIRGILGGRSQAMQQHLQQQEDSVLSTQLFLSQVQDLDYAEAVTQMQSASVQLQANMQTSSMLLNLSLLDFLR